jgi:hypothetical protein
MTPSDKKPKKLTAAEAQTEFEKKMLAYMEERFLNLVNQVRAVCIAANISPNDFWNAFVNDKAQDDFYVKLHVAQDLHNAQFRGAQDSPNGKIDTSKLGVPTDLLKKE